MLSRRDAPFPFDAVRDLLGIARVMYAAAAAQGAGAPKLARIATAGLELVAALDLAAGAPVGSVGHRAAWARAEKAAHMVSDLVELTDTAEPLVKVAIARAVGT